ncbi:MAG: ATP-binding protein [Saprospiraceae bacterium]|nr:ATP-binding protein [Saprospiraceae bacterium]
MHKEAELSFKEESTGTKTVLILGGLLLETLEKGGIVFIDELDTSLHTYLAKLLVMLFQNQKVNNKNAQLIFISHDTNLLDRTLLRKDQIWFTEKDEQGVTELISLQDFTDVRQNTPYEKWYLAGKFGALPNLKSIEKFHSI